MVGIIITKHPQNQTVCEGGNVTVTCGFYGINLIPNWIIGNTTFGASNINNNDMLFTPNTNNTNDTVLILFSITASLNGTEFQCEFQLNPPVYSFIGKLTIMGKA